MSSPELVLSKYDCGNLRMCWAKSCRSSRRADVDSFAEIVGITKLVNALTVKIMRIAKQTQMSSLNLPLEKITLRPDSVRTRNC